MIASGLWAPSPRYGIAGWASSAALAEVFGTPAMLLNDDRLGRALEAFAPQAEAIRGAVALAAIERFGVEAGRLHLDLTALKVCGAPEHSSLSAPLCNPAPRPPPPVHVPHPTPPTAA